MGFHTYDVERADRLEDESRYRYLSRDELVYAVEPNDDDVLVDLGSGTGFYTDDIAPHVRKVYAVDLQEEMHQLYHEKGVPKNVETVTAEISDLPLDDNSIDTAFSTMTYHEFASSEALEEVRRTVSDRLVIADWSSEGSGESGPPLDERYDASQAEEHLRDTSFVVERSEERPETFVIVATY